MPHLAARYASLRRRVDELARAVEAIDDPAVRDALRVLDADLHLLRLALRERAAGELGEVQAAAVYPPTASRS